MIPNQNRIKQQSNPTLQEHYAISQPTTTAFISTEIMETDAEKESVRQASETIYDEPKLAKNQETKRQEKTPCIE